MTNVIILFPKIEDATSIKNLLVRNGYSISAVCTTGAKALAAIDEYNDGIVVCGYKFADMLYSQLRESLPREFEMLLLASQARLCEGICEGVVPVAMPLKAYDLVNTMEMLTQNIMRRRRIRKAEPRKRDNDEKKTIQEAKRVLMEKNHMSEEEAHRYIQKTSMDSGTKMVETAQMVLRIMLS